MPHTIRKIKLVLDHFFNTLFMDPLFQKDRLSFIKINEITLFWKSKMPENDILVSNELDKPSNIAIIG